MATSPANLSPKQRFQTSKPSMEQHRDMVSSNRFDLGVDIAMLEYQARLAHDPANLNGNLAAAAFFKLAGAQEFITVLRNLAESPRIPDGPKPPNLNHKV